MHRDSPGIEPESTDEDPPRPHRRFAKLVESTAARRVALPRLAVAISLGLSGVVLCVYAGGWAVRSVTGWVAALPDQQIAFADIELVPEPDWIVGGRRFVLEQIRSTSKRGDRLELLNLDLKAFKNELQVGSPWVRKVGRLQKLPRGLKVELEIRKPVAVVLMPEHVLNAHPIDGDGVVLARREIDWVRDRPLQVRGIADPLIQIARVDNRSQPIVWTAWKRVDENGQPGETDQMVVKAAQIAEFLQHQAKTSESGRPGPRITHIFLPDEPSHSFFIKDADDNNIRWGKATDDDGHGELPPDARWKILLDHVDKHGPLDAKYPRYCEFTRTGLEFKEYKKPSH